MSNRDYTQPDEVVERAFQEIDTDGDRSIGLSDVKAFFRNIHEELTDEEAQRLIRVLDRNGDGLVSLAEFKALCDPVKHGLHPNIPAS